MSGDFIKRKTIIHRMNDTNLFGSLTYTTKAQQPFNER